VPVQRRHWPGLARLMSVRVVFGADHDRNHRSGRPGGCCSDLVLDQLAPLRSRASKTLGRAPDCSLAGMVVPDLLPGLALSFPALDHEPWSGIEPYMLDADDLLSFVHGSRVPDGHVVGSLM
jgi:hypothetical protein